MFLESTNRAGWIEVVCGSMFSGKTEELIRRLKRAQFARQKVEIFKPKIDVRYSDEDVVSHDANTIRCTPVENSGNILLLTGDVDVVGIDEAQFFDSNIVSVCNDQIDRSQHDHPDQKIGSILYGSRQPAFCRNPYLTG